MSNKHKFIGVFGSCLHEQNQINFLSSLRENCIKTGYTAIAFSASHNSTYDEDSAKGELKLLELFKYIHLDCIIILTETIKNHALIDKVVSIGHSKNIPVFSIDGTIDGCYNMPLDYKSGFRNIVRHVIIEHNADKVNMLAGFKGNDFSEERVDIYKEILEECGIPFEEERLGYGDFWERPSRVAIQKFLDSDLEMPRAIICANDSMAITACTMLSENGYRVPEDIIVTGFDGTQSSKYNFPAITSCTPDYSEALEFIIQETMHVKETGAVNPCNHMIGFNIIKSQSCGCEPNTIHNHTEIISTLYDATGDSSWHMLAMNALVTNILKVQYIEDMATLLPEAVKLWSQNFRFACVKSELTKEHINYEHYTDATGELTDMTTILRVNNQQFDESYENFNVQEFVPNFNDIIDNPGTIMLVRLINYGTQVYGYSVDEINELNLRSLQRCNEFDMFLAHCINTVLHNYALYELNRNLEHANEEISALSVHDPMTGVYNRRGFYSKLGILLKDPCYLNKYLFIVFIDMDGLKGINDNFGHKEGDFAITTLAQALSKIDVNDPLCARFGGDEFICAFFADDPSYITRNEIKEQIMNHIKQSPGVDQKRYPIDFSIGVLCRMSKDIKHIDDIILSTDKMMYVDKMTKKHKR